MTLQDRKTRKCKDTRDRMAKMALMLFERHGYEAVTMEQIAVAADVARGTLYNHFPLKEAVLAYGIHAELQSGLGPLLQQALSQPTLATSLMVLLQASAHWWEAHRQYARPYIRYRFQDVREGSDAGDASDMITVYARVIAEARARNEIRADVQPLRLARYLHYLYLCAVMSWLGGQNLVLKDEFSDVISFFMRAVAVVPTGPSMQPGA